MMLRRAVCILALILVSVTMTAAETVPVSVTARRIEHFRAKSEERRFGAFEFVGGLELTSRQPLFGSLSAIRFRADGQHFVSVLDTGYWLTGRIERDTQGHLLGVSDVRITGMRDQRGREPRNKADIDAEGLALRAGQVAVSFERRHRVDFYPDPGYEEARPQRSLDLPIPKQSLSRNGGLETLVAAPVDGPLKGALLTIAEDSTDRDGHLYAAILDGPLKGAFRVVRNDPWSVTDGAFLPGGDLLLLERRFSVIGGVGMRIRRIAGNALRPGALIDGPVLLEADMGFEIDNMEGIDVIAGADGHPHVILVSDDNQSVFQRSLMLEFRLLQ